MKISLKDNEKFVLRFDKGEEVIAGIASFMKEHGVYACSFSAIGSAAEVELGYYNSFLKEYRHKPFVENLEVISLNGNGCCCIFVRATRIRGSGNAPGHQGSSAEPVRGKTPALGFASAGDAAPLSILCLNVGFIDTRPPT